MHRAVTPNDDDRNRTRPMFHSAHFEHRAVAPSANRPHPLRQ